MAAFRRNQPEALILLTRVPDPQNYGVAELDADGGVMRLVEKPAEPASDLALVGVYMFTPRIHEAARAIQPSGRGELEITDAIQWLVDSKHPVESHVVRGWWKDTGRLDDMLEANRLILETLDRRVEGELTDSQIEGRVVDRAGRGARALDRPRPRRDRRGRAARRRLHRPVHGDRAPLHDRVGGDRALDPARRLLGQGPRRAHGVLAARPRRRDRPRRAPAARLPLHGRRLSSEIGIL